MTSVYTVTCHTKHDTSEISTFVYEDAYQGCELALRFARICADDPQFIAVSVKTPNGTIIYDHDFSD